MGLRENPKTKQNNNKYVFWIAVLIESYGHNYILSYAFVNKVFPPMYYMIVWKNCSTYELAGRTHSGVASTMLNL